MSLGGMAEIPLGALRHELDEKFAARKVGSSMLAVCLSATMEAVEALEERVERLERERIAFGGSGGVGAQPPPNLRCPECGHITADPFNCPTCKNPMAPYGQPGGTEQQPSVEPSATSDVSATGAEQPQSEERHAVQLGIAADIRGTAAKLMARAADREDDDARFMVRMAQACDRHASDLGYYAEPAPAEQPPGDWSEAEVADAEWPSAPEHVDVSDNGLLAIENKLHGAMREPEGTAFRYYACMALIDEVRRLRAPAEQPEQAEPARVDDDVALQDLGAAMERVRGCDEKVGDDGLCDCARFIGFLIRERTRHVPAMRAVIEEMEAELAAFRSAPEQAKRGAEFGDEISAAYGRACRQGFLGMEPPSRYAAFVAGYRAGALRSAPAERVEDGQREADFFDLARLELARARERFGPINGPHEGYAVLAEEVDELWDAVKSMRPAEHPAHFLLECIQIAAMAGRFAVDLELAEYVGAFSGDGKDATALRKLRDRALRAAPSAQQGGEIAWLPSHWRESLAEHPDWIVGAMKHPDTSEEWERVLILRAPTDTKEQP